MTPAQQAFAECYYPIQCPSSVQRLWECPFSADDCHPPISRREAASFQFRQNEPIEFVTRPLTLFHRRRPRVRDRLSAQQLRCFGVTVN